jgi:LPXTG-motif cell wall-anchored protein
MRVVRTLVPLILAALAVGLPAAPAAAAEEYPPPPPALTANPGTIFVGNTTTVTGVNYGPNDLVTLTITYQTNAAPAPAGAEYVPVSYVARQQVQADANGSFTTIVRLTTPGLAIITGTGSPSGRTASTSVRVLPLGSSLPVTGSSTNYAGIALAGSAVAAAGVLLMVLARSRRQRRASIQ